MSQTEARGSGTDSYKPWLKELLVLILGQPPSTTSLDPPGAELGNLVGRDEPEHDILEEPHEHLAMDRGERRALA